MHDEVDRLQVDAVQVMHDAPRITADSPGSRRQTAAPEARQINRVDVVAKWRESLRYRAHTLNPPAPTVQQQHRRAAAHTLPGDDQTIQGIECDLRSGHRAPREMRAPPPIRLSIPWSKVR